MMPYDLVIQDSDDEEEDPLPELPPPQTNRVFIANGDMQHGAGDHRAHDISHGAQIGVNFDDFLQSQEAAHANLTSSQQRREERWIPSIGRMGTMMTEIGLAQQRLFDDDHELGNQLPQAIEPDAPSTFGYNINQANIPGEETIFARDDEPADFTAQPAEPLPNASSDWSQSAPSYNIFESSSVQPSSNHLNRADFLDDSVALLRPGPILNSPGRWNSTEATPFSPHDTIPFSSVISPKATRTKSDSVAMNGLQTSQTSVDELAMPVMVEMPRVEKKIGRKKKQSLPDNDEDDELAQPAKAQEPASNKPEKRKPGRPPKNPKVSPEENSNSLTTNEFAPVPAQNGAEPSPLAGADRIYNEPISNPMIQPQVIITELAKDNQQTSPMVILPEASTKKPAKEPKKKKLKRGKTTSAIPTKTYEPDVEDDVIWIDERPIIPLSHDEQPTTDATDQNHDKNGASEPAAQATQAPKKRGRKRKKTAEQHAAEEAALNDQVDAQLQSTESPLQQLNNSPNQTASVVLNNRNKPSSIDTPDPEPHTTNDTENDPASTETNTHQAPETPRKSDPPQTPAKGPGKHSPISTTSKVPYRVGLSRRARIAPLLKIVKR